jgi:hypothetical protein
MRSRVNGGAGAPLAIGASTSSARAGTVRMSRERHVAHRVCLFRTCRIEPRARTRSFAMGSRGLRRTVAVVKLAGPRPATAGARPGGRSRSGSRTRCGARSYAPASRASARGGTPCRPEDGSGDRNGRSESPPHTRTAIPAVVWSASTTNEVDTNASIARSRRACQLLDAQEQYVERERRRAAMRRALGFCYCDRPRAGRRAVLLPGWISEKLHAPNAMASI